MFLSVRDTPFLKILTDFRCCSRGIENSPSMSFNFICKSRLILCLRQMCHCVSFVLTAFPVRLSYCTAKKIPNRKCNLGEVVVTMEGEFPFALNPVGEIACQCSETLVLKTDRPHGSRTQQVYSCGQV